jgi:hypothetical protein
MFRSTQSDAPSPANSIRTPLATGRHEVAARAVTGSDRSPIGALDVLENRVIRAATGAAERLQNEIQLAYNLTIMAARRRSGDLERRADALPRRLVRTQTRRHRLELSRQALQAERQAMQIEVIEQSFSRLALVLEALDAPRGRGTLSRGPFRGLPRHLRLVLDDDDPDARMRVALAYAASIRRELAALAPELMDLLANDLIRAGSAEHLRHVTPLAELRPLTGTR